MRKLFLTFFYTGLSPKAPGTVGTFAAVPFGLLVLAYAPPSTLFLVAILVSVLAAKAITAYENETQLHDASHIVIDEAVGVWIAMAIAPGVMIPWESYSVGNEAIFIPLVLSILYFRLFDILKPSFIGRIDRDVAGGWGVMGDDIAAGFVAGITSALTYAIWEKLAL
ncbi:MAG: phosphatidylglycerophosphatase [Sulfuricurvum sp. PC08-66]|nr:MAG: phosphatidylglycerophosphatase [Sulfuricurvum sp. PC08-66]